MHNCDIPPAAGPPLLGIAPRVIVVAHQEDTTQLRSAFLHEGFAYQEVREAYSPREQGYSAAVKCLINHASAWRLVTQDRGFVIVVEADFVPVCGIASLPLPFVPEPGVPAMAWLYSVGPVIYHVDNHGAIHGHNAGTVGYVLDRHAAAALLALYDNEMVKREPGRYRSWEVSFPIALRWERGIRCYIPYRMYGEHGGLANPEHRQSGVRSWHEADALAGPLHFLPPYAGNSRITYKLRRLRGRLRGFYRLLCGKYFDGWGPWWRCENRFQILRIALRRLL